MSLLDSIRYRVRVLARPQAHEMELAEELEFHVGLDAMQQQHASHGGVTCGMAASRRRRGRKSISRIIRRP